MHLDRNRKAYGDNTVCVNGRKVDTEEVEALEKVASILGPS